MKNYISYTTLGIFLLGLGLVGIVCYIRYLFYSIKGRLIYETATYNFSPSNEKGRINAQWLLTISSCSWSKIFYEISSDPKWSGNAIDDKTYLAQSEELKGVLLPWQRAIICYPVLYGIKQWSHFETIMEGHIKYGTTPNNLCYYFTYKVKMLINSNSEGEYYMARQELIDFKS